MTRGVIMKNKKWIFIIIGIVVLCICFTAGGIIKKNNNGYKTTDLVLKGLERAVNNTDDNSIIKCYPEFMQKSLPVLSYDSIKEFHDKVGNITFNILKQNELDSDEILSKQNDINAKYNCNIKLEGYALVACKYNDDFGETTFEMIKIDGRWYLYYDAYLPEPIQYFVE